MNGDDKKMIEEIFKPMDDKLAEFQRSFVGMSSDVATIKVEQKYQGQYIEALQLDVRGLHDKADRMPDTWRGEIDSAISNCREQRNEITSVQNLAKERERARLDTVKRDRRASLIPGGFGSLLKALLPYILLGLAAVGAYMASKLAGPDDADVVKALETIERVEAKVDAMNGEGK